MYKLQMKMPKRKPVFEEEKPDLEEKLAHVQSKAPHLDISRVRSSIDPNSYGKMENYLVDKIFVNGLLNIPPDIEYLPVQQAYFDLAMYYWERFDLRVKDNKLITSMLSYLSGICDLFFNTSHLPRILGESELYTTVANYMINV